MKLILQTVPVVFLVVVAALAPSALGQDAPAGADSPSGQPDQPAASPADQEAPRDAAPSGPEGATAAEEASAPAVAQTGQPQWPQDPDGWFLVTPEGAQATVAMPVSPVPSERQMVPVEGLPIHVRMMAAVDDQRVNYVFAWHDQKAPNGVADIRNTLDGAVKGALGSTLGQLESAEPLHLNGNPGCDFRIRFAYREQPMRVAGRVILVGPRVYQLTCVVPDGVEAEALITKFAGSFVHVPEPPGTPEQGEPPAAAAPPSGDSGGSGR
jgi:hypothetical protein